MPLASKQAPMYACMYARLKEESNANAEMSDSMYV